jgi:hypothetical protein
MYLMGAEALGYKPVGVVFCGFRQSASAAGWVQTPFFPETGSACSQAQIDELAATARELAIQTAADLAGGRIAVEPDDDSKCFRCSYLKICRSDVARGRRTAVGGMA